MFAEAASYPTILVLCHIIAQQRFSEVDLYGKVMEKRVEEQEVSTLTKGSRSWREQSSRQPGHGICHTGKRWARLVEENISFEVFSTDRQTVNEQEA